MTTAAPRRARARRGEGERLREEILAAAERLLLETGSEEAVSIRAVAAAVGVTPPSIYRHFADKNHLLFEVCAVQMARLGEHLRSAMAEVDDPVVALGVMGEAYVRFGVEHPEHYRIMFMGRSDLTPEQYADELLVETSPFAMLVAMCQRAVDAGATRHRDAFRVALVLWSAVHGLTSLLVAKPNLPWPDVDVLVHDLLDVVVGGEFPTPG
ncbi:MAG TPA: TetR/AcrR family transcriptional regulator [Acidimicrobiales bacterium]|jgi:AcrR family transcriptional regulator